MNDASILFAGKCRVQKQNLVQSGVWHIILSGLSQYLLHVAWFSSSGYSMHLNQAIHYRLCAILTTYFEILWRLWILIYKDHCLYILILSLPVLYCLPQFFPVRQTGRFHDRYEWYNLLVSDHTTLSWLSFPCLQNDPSGENGDNAQIFGDRYI